jgi:uncharacterized protein DUF3106
MRAGKFQFAAGLGSLLLAGLLAQPAFAEGGFGTGRGRRPNPGAQRPAQNKPVERKNLNPNVEANPSNQRQPNARGMMGLPPKWVDRLREMSPEEQERFMHNNARFQSLPPERQAQVRENLRRWNQLSPTERNALRDRERVWEQMSPEQRAYVRNQLLPKWQQLPQERRQLLLGRLRMLRGLSPSEREARLNDENFLQGLDPNERQILRDLSNLRGLPTP